MLTLVTDTNARLTVNSKNAVALGFELEVTRILDVPCPRATNCPSSILATFWFEEVHVTVRSAAFAGNTAATRFLLSPTRIGAVEFPIVTLST